MTSAKLTSRQSLFVGVTLFSMFFGAGNLIIPPLLGLQAGGGDLLGAGDLCCLDGIDQRGCGHGSDKKQGYQFALFHARFLLFGYGWGFATRTIPQTVAEVETNRHTARKIDEQIYSATATTHQR